MRACSYFFCLLQGQALSLSWTRENEFFFFFRFVVINPFFETYRSPREREDLFFSLFDTFFFFSMSRDRCPVVSWRNFSFFLWDREAVSRLSLRHVAALDFLSCPGVAGLWVLSMGVGLSHCGGMGRGGWLGVGGIFFFWVKWLSLPWVFSKIGRILLLSSQIWKAGGTFLNLSDNFF